MKCILSYNNFIMQINIMIYAREPYFEVYHTAYNNNHNDDFVICVRRPTKKTKKITEGYEHAFVEFY